MQYFIKNIFIKNETFNVLGYKKFNATLALAVNL